MSTSSDSIDMAALVDAIRQERSDAKKQLRSLFESGLRYFLRRELHIKQDNVDDVLNECLNAAIFALRLGDPVPPERLPGTILAIMRAEISRRKAAIVAPRPVPGPVPFLEAAQKVLASSSPKQRAILRAHYAVGQSPQEICRTAGVSPDACAQTIRGKQIEFAALCAGQKGPKLAGGGRHPPAREREAPGSRSTSSPPCLAVPD